jgi:hypothetical protein
VKARRQDQARTKGQAINRTDANPGFQDLEKLKERLLTVLDPVKLVSILASTFQDCGWLTDLIAEKNSLAVFVARFVIADVIDD